MIELIPLTIGIEQNFKLSYNDTTYAFNLRYNDYADFWFLDIREDETQNAVFLGLKLLPNINALKFFEYLKLGKLALIDTMSESVNALNVKNDLGDRLKLYRSI